MRLIIWVLFLSSALVVGSGRHLDAKTSDPQTIVPFNDQTVEGVGNDWNVISFELAPGTIHSWHSQPRGEFLYVLEGAGRLEVDGKPAITLNPGSVSTLTSTPHHALKNTSRTKALKILVVFLNEQSKPHPLLASTLTQDHQGIRDGTSTRTSKPRPEPQQRPGDIGLVSERIISMSVEAGERLVMQAGLSIPRPAGWRWTGARGLHIEYGQ